MSAAIELRLEKISQLFSTLDPFPFREKDLDKDAEDFIVDWARELGDRDIELVIHLPAAEANTTSEAELGSAINGYFGYRAEMIALELKELFRNGRRSLAIGLAVLAACLTAERALESAMAPGEVPRVIGEGLIILGWVANWRPLEIFLYDWWPIAKRRNLYRRLASMPVRFEVRRQTERGTS